MNLAEKTTEDQKDIFNFRFVALKVKLSYADRSDSLDARCCNAALMVLQIFCLNMAPVTRECGPASHYSSIRGKAYAGDGR